MSRARTRNRLDPKIGMVELLLSAAVAAVVWGAGSLFVPARAAGAASTSTATAKGADTSAATPSGGAEARYQRDRARCLAGQSQEDTKTCLREAAAALQASREHDLKDPGAAQLAANARARCNVFKTEDDRRACLARVSGDATIAGSVAGGGILRQSTEIIPPPESMPPTAAGPARPAPTSSTGTLPTPPSPAVLPPANTTTPTGPTSPTPPAR